MSYPPFQQQITFLYTEDLARAAAFYGDLLGLELVLDQEVCKIFQVSQGAFIGVCSHRQAPGPHDNIILTLVTDDVDGWYARLKEMGVEIEKAPTHNPKFNIYQMFLRDPDGYLIEIQKFMSPEWPAASN